MLSVYLAKIIFLCLYFKSSKHFNHVFYIKLRLIIASCIEPNRNYTIFDFMSDYEYYRLVLDGIKILVHG